MAISSFLQEDFHYVTKMLSQRYHTTKSKKKELKKMA